MPKINYGKLYTLRADGRYQGYWHELDADGLPRGPRHTICDRDPEKLYQRIQAKEQPATLTFAPSRRRGSQKNGKSTATAPLTATRPHMSAQLRGSVTAPLIVSSRATLPRTCRLSRRLTTPSGRSALSGLSIRAFLPLPLLTPFLARPSGQTRHSASRSRAAPKRRRRGKLRRTTSLMPLRPARERLTGASLPYF